MEGEEPSPRTRWIDTAPGQRDPRRLSRGVEKWEAHMDLADFKYGLRSRDGDLIANLGN
jgi:hypothetical protein